MSDLFKFDLQRFGNVVYLPNGAADYVTLSAITPGDTDAEAGQFYWASETASIQSTFDGDVTVSANQIKKTVTAENEDDDDKEYYVVSGVYGIALPSSGGTGTITAGTAVGTGDDGVAAITGLNNATLTFGDVTFGFSDADTDAAVQIAGSTISEVDLNSGSFAITAAGGVTGLHVNGTSADDVVSVDKPFTYTAGVTSGDESISIITVTETGASIGGTDSAATVVAPAADTVTVNGTAFEYTIGADVASIDVSSGVGIYLQAVNDKVVINDSVATLISDGNFSVYEGTTALKLTELPTVSGYTLTKIADSEYEASGLASSVTLSKGTYAIENTSGSAAVRLQLTNSKTSISGLVLGTGDVLSGDLTGIGTVSLYGGAADSATKINLEEINEDAIVTRQESSFEISSIASGGALAVNDFSVDGENSVYLAYNNKGGWVNYTDEGAISASIGSGTTEENQGELSITYMPEEVQDITVNGTTFNVNNWSTAYTIYNRKNVLSIADLINDAVVTAEGIASVFTDENGATMTINGGIYTTDDDEGTDNVLVFNSDGSMDESSSTGFTYAGEAPTEDTSDEGSDEGSDEASDEESDQTSDEESDQTSDEESDQTSDEESDQTSDEESDQTSDEESDQTSDEESDQTSDEESDQTSDEESDDEGSDDEEIAYDSDDVTEDTNMEQRESSDGSIEHVFESSDGDAEIVLSVDSGSGEASTLTLVDGRTEESSTPLVINFDTASAKERGMDSFKNLDLSSAMSPVNVIGTNHNFEYLKGSNYGGILTARIKGSSLEGGDGDDKLYGASGVDTFIQSGGSDIVKGYSSSSDLIRLMGYLISRVC